MQQEINCSINIRVRVIIRSSEQSTMNSCYWLPATMKIIRHQIHKINGRKNARDVVRQIASPLTSTNCYWQRVAWTQRLLQSLQQKYKVVYILPRVPIIIRIFPENGCWGFGWEETIINQLTSQCLMKKRKKNLKEIASWTYRLYLPMPLRLFRWMKARILFAKLFLASGFAAMADHTGIKASL